MKIYKVPLRNDPETQDDDGHIGYRWTYSKREADRIFKTNGADAERGDCVEEIEFAFNKPDILRFLNIHCSYPDNG